jgi:hypothetical protein
MANTNRKKYEKEPPWAAMRAVWAASASGPRTALSFLSSFPFRTPAPPPRKPELLPPLPFLFSTKNAAFPLPNPSRLRFPPPRPNCSLIMMRRNSEHEAVAKRKVPTVSFCNLPMVCEHILKLSTRTLLSLFNTCFCFYRRIFCLRSCRCCQ